jgi:hippurate hydrolase
VAENIARAHGATAEVEIEPGFPVTVNDADAVQHAETAITGLFGAEAWHRMASPIMGAEDFSYVLHRAKGAMIFLGVCPEGQDFRGACPCHSNKMVLNEAMMARGVAVHCALAERFLREGFSNA